jgi:hypothetical protein
MNKIATVLHDIPRNHASVLIYPEVCDADDHPPMSAPSFEPSGLLLVVGIADANRLLIVCSRTSAVVPFRSKLQLIKCSLALFRSSNDRDSHLLAWVRQDVELGESAGQVCQCPPKVCSPRSLGVNSPRRLEVNLCACSCQPTHPSCSRWSL